jgi:hypothetical protein
LFYRQHIMGKESPSSPDADQIWKDNTNTVMYRSTEYSWRVLGSPMN